MKFRRCSENLSNSIQARIPEGIFTGTTPSLRTVDCVNVSALVLEAMIAPPDLPDAFYPTCDLREYTDAMRIIADSPPAFFIPAQAADPLGTSIHYLSDDAQPMRSIFLSRSASIRWSAKENVVQHG